MFEFNDQTSQTPAPHLFLIYPFCIFGVVLSVLLSGFKKPEVLRSDEQVA